MLHGHDHTAVDDALRERIARTESFVLPDEATCAICGCTDSNACPGGCWWIPDPAGQMRDVCSRCERSAIEIARCEAEIAKIEADPDQNIGALIGWLDWHAEKSHIAGRAFRRHREARRKRIRSHRRRRPR